MDPSQMYGGSSMAQFLSFSGTPSQMFETSTRTPPSEYSGPSSSQQYYQPKMPFYGSKDVSQSVEVEETDEESKSPPLPPQLER